jgi:Tol biopolymer transport system component
MGESPLGRQPSEKPQEDQLGSWKEIATYLKRDVTTVQRWEKREGMPVQRHVHDKMGSVYASRDELDAWMSSRKIQAERQNGSGDLTPQPASEPLQPAKNSSIARWTLVLPLTVAAAGLTIGVALWLLRTEHFWRNPITDARFQAITDFDGLEQAAAVSRDGHFVAFLSDREGPMDVWVTQVGSGEFHNLTHGSIPGLVNSDIRNLGFSPDGSLVTFWFRKPGGPGGHDISVGAVPTLGGPPRPYLEGVAEYTWSQDGSRLAYHTPGPGDPLFVSDGSLRPGNQPTFTAAAGLHSHFPLWAPDAAFIYFIRGTLPDRLDIWRIPPSGGPPERITSHDGRVSYPVFINRKTLMYLASDSDGSGPWLYSMDVDHRLPHRLTFGPDRYTSLASIDDGRRLVATVASPRRTLWLLRIDDASMNAAAPTQIPLTTSMGVSPRLGPHYLVYVSTTPTGDTIWNFAEGAGTEVWRQQQAQVVGGPAISPDGQSLAFTIRQHGQTFLYAMKSDGSNPRILVNSLNLQGSPAWAPDGQSIISAAEESGIPHLFRVPVDGRPPSSFIREYSVDPVWSPDGRFVAYSGPDIGTTFSVKAVNAEAIGRPLSTLTLTRGSRHLAFLPGGHALVVLRGEMQHKDLWLIDLDTGVERQLTKLSPDFDVTGFDISPDGHEVVFERVQERSDVVMLDLHP